MIDAAIGQIASQLNQALKRAFPGGEDLVVVSSLCEQDGKLAKDVDNKLVVFLVNIEREAVPCQSARSGGTGSRFAFANEPVHLNLLVMFAAHFSANYPDALKLIASTVSFFQGRPVFDHQNTPELDTRIAKLTLDIENLSLSDLSNLWGVLSGKYLPSVLYRLRMVSIDAGQISSIAPRVVRVETGAQA